MLNSYYIQHEILWEEWRSYLKFYHFKIKQILADFLLYLFYLSIDFNKILEQSSINISKSIPEEKNVVDFFVYAPNHKFAFYFNVRYEFKQWNKHVLCL